MQKLTSYISFLLLSFVAAGLYEECVELHGNPADLATAVKLARCCEGKGQQVDMLCVLSTVRAFSTNSSCLTTDKCGFPLALKHGFKNVGPRMQRPLCSVSVPSNDAYGAPYVAHTAGLTDSVDYSFYADSLYNYRPLDMFRCEILRTVDTGTYTETEIVFTPGAALDDSAAIVLNIKLVTGGTSMALPLIPMLPSSFVFGSNVDWFSLVNADGTDVTVTATAQAPLAIDAAMQLNNQIFCDPDSGDAIIGETVNYDTMLGNLTRCNAIYLDGYVKQKVLELAKEEVLRKVVDALPSFPKAE